MIHVFLFVMVLIPLKFLSGFDIKIHNMELILSLIYFGLSLSVSIFIIHILAKLMGFQIEMLASAGISEKVETHMLSFSNTDIDKIYENFRQNKDLANKNQLRETLIQNQRKVVHDIKSPVLRIKRFLKNTENKSWIDSQLDQIACIATKILDSEGDHDPDFDVSEPDIIIHQLILSYDSVFPDINFKLKRSNDFLFSGMTRSELERIFSNIIDNSIESGSDSIELSISKGNSFIEMVVQDNGPGFPSELLDQIFKSEVRSQKLGGHGIGLLSVVQIIEGCGGSISADNNSTGAKITIMIPAKTCPWYWLQSISSKCHDHFVFLVSDITPYQYWIDSMKLKVIHYSNSRSFQREYLSVPARSQYVIESDFDSIESGTDIIEKYKLVSRSILVDERNQDHRLEAKCAQLGLRKIFKDQIHKVEIVNLSYDNMFENANNIIFDDDEFILTDFSIFCSTSNFKDPLTLKDPDYKLISEKSRDSVILIDKYFDHSEINGLEIGMKLFQLGFKNLYLHSNEVGDIPYWFKGFLNKGDYQGVSLIKS